MQIPCGGMKGWIQDTLIFKDKIKICLREMG